ncbi:MAG: MEMO1 family protein [Candidatus Micrarchaeia archaeon]
MRKEAVSGSFYPSNKVELEHFINAALKSANVKGDLVKKAYSYVSPHAGYIYSGMVAAYTYKALSLHNDFKNIETAVIIGPNHTGYGSAIAISSEDWHTPLGVAANDLEFSYSLSHESNYLEIDEAAHKSEHSIEVQLPFLQTLFKGKPIRYVFVCMGDQSVASSELLAHSIAKTEEKLGRKIVVIASSDFNHYESAEVAGWKDKQLIEALLKLNYKKFNDSIYSVNDSACGFGPITVAMLYAKGKGAARGALLKYSNSGEVTKDFESVVAYASLAFI